MANQEKDTFITGSHTEGELQDSIFVPHEDHGVQLWLQAYPTSKTEPYEFARENGKENHPVYIATSEASTKERADDWAGAPPDFNIRFNYWVRETSQFFSNNKDYFIMEDGKEDWDFYKRLFHVANIQIEDNFDDIDFSQVSVSIFNRYFANDARKSSLVGQYAKDVLDAENLLNGNRQDKNDNINRYKRDRDIIWKTAHILGSSYSPDLALHLIDSEVNIKAGYDFNKYLDSLVDKTAEDKPLFEDIRNDDLVKKLGDYREHPNVVAAQEKMGQASENEVHVDSAAKYDADGKIQPAPAPKEPEKGKEVSKPEAVVSKEGPLGSFLSAPAFLPEEDKEQSKLKPIKGGSNGEFFYSGSSVGNENGEVEFPSAIDVEDVSRETEVLVAATPTKIDEAPSELPESVTGIEIRSSKVNNAEIPLNLHVNEKDLDNVVISLFHSLHETGKGYFHVPGISVTDKEAIDKAFEVLSRLKTQEKSISLTNVGYEIVNRSDVRGGRAVQVNCAIKRTRRTIRPTSSS